MKIKYNKGYSNPYVFEGIEINEKLLKKYLSKEGEKKLTEIDDLSQVNPKTSSELLKVLEQMVKSKNYFKYCSSLLININPGPNNMYDYLNLKKWSSTISSKNIEVEEKKPHLYTFMQYVYETMIKENKDQVVNLLGPIGSGKTFNLIHIMEFFITKYGPKNYKNELFELIHNSIQLIHIFGSVYRENNLESTSCGIEIKLGFNQNNIISNFDIESQILDLSLPFSDNGRTFNIFHAFIKGANEELKKICKIPEDDRYLTFFRNYLSNFTEKMRDKMTFNDLETWNKFYSLSKYFKFSNDEIVNILNCLALILNLNELTISKVKIKKKSSDEDGSKEEQTEENIEKEEYYEIQKDNVSKKISKNLGIRRREFLKQIGKFKSLHETKTFIISFMKQTYYIIFYFVLNKIKERINLYFNELNEKIGTNNFKKNKIIYFLDFPGEVENNNLGGFITNIYNECLNMYAATGFYEIAEKLIKENIYLNKFFPIKSYYAVSTCFDKEGIIEQISKPLNKQNFNSLINNSLSKANFVNCIKFSDNKSFEEKHFEFSYSFSHKKIYYNFENLYIESKSLLKNDIVVKLFSLAQNYVINCTYKNLIINSSKDFYSLVTSILYKFFGPIKDIKPFNIICLHSNKNYEIFCKNRENLNADEATINPKANNINNKSYKDDKIQKSVALEYIKNSFVIPVLFWNWHGYKEWIKIDEFIKDYSYDFEKIKDRIIEINNTDPDRKKFNSESILKFNDLPKEEVAKCTLGILSKESDYIIGKEYIIMRTGTLKKMRNYLNGMINTAKKMNNDLKEKIRKEKEKENSIYLKRKSNNINLNFQNQIEEIKSSVKRSSYINRKTNGEIHFKYEQIPLPKKKQYKNGKENNSRRYLLKEQCIINIISDEQTLNDEDKRKIMKGKYFNLFYLISNKNTDKGKEELNKDKIYLEDLKINKKENEPLINEMNNISLKNEIFTVNKNKNKNRLKIYENEKNIEIIIKIQSHIRKVISKNKYIVLKYIYSKIIHIQKFIRGHLTRLKFKKFLDCLEKIKLIQRLYRRRYYLMVKSATKLQEFYIKKLAGKKLKEKIIAKKKAEKKGEYYNMEIEPFEDFSHNNYNLENALRIIRIKKNSEKITNRLINEKDPKKIVNILLYGKPEKDDLTRAEKLGISLKIEDKLINQGDIMKERKKELAQIYEDKFKEIHSFNPKINKKKDIINKIFRKKNEFYEMFKDKNIKKEKKEDFKNNENEKIHKNRNYDSYLNNVFDRLHNEKLKIEQRKKIREEYLNSNRNSNNIANKNKSSKKPLKELLLNDKIKEIYKMYSPEIVNKNDIWPKNIENNYFKDDKNGKTISPIKNNDNFNEEEKKE